MPLHFARSRSQMCPNSSESTQSSAEEVGSNLPSRRVPPQRCQRHPYAVCLGDSPDMAAEDPSRGALDYTPDSHEAVFRHPTCSRRAVDNVGVPLRHRRVRVSLPQSLPTEPAHRTVGKASLPRLLAAAPFRQREAEVAFVPARECAERREPEQIRNIGEAAFVAFEVAFGKVATHVVHE